MDLDHLSRREREERQRAAQAECDGKRGNFNSHSHVIIPLFLGWFF